MSVININYLKITISSRTSVLLEIYIHVKILKIQDLKILLRLEVYNFII